MKMLIIIMILDVSLGEVLPPLWNEAPSSLAEYPLMNGTTTIDPWNYTQRLGLYKILLKETTEAFRCFGPENKGNVLWGLPLQHGWQ